ncbi:hypothetical protein BKA62DRAFT_707386 [Auriculariales sp. MPI-PUGE-AT-0066]|nr:hypothetical protein BKA62DRAFT_707386 [Auriculariales sp. MPI-PUGE-AT-0066]
MSSIKPSRSKRVVKTLGPDSVMGEGDTELVLNIVPEDLAKDAFELLKDEVGWQTMFHRGGEVPRRVAVQGEVAEDGSYPVYRHPADSSPPLKPFTPTVDRIRRHIEHHLNHPVNHVLIQLYRSGHDFISEHSDKTIDVVHDTKIVNVSFGAERLMILRPKREKASADAGSGSSTPGVAGSTASVDSSKANYRGPPRAAQRIPLAHNSMFVLGLETNGKWLHTIRQDKRPDSTKAPAELAYGGERISLTFRHIGTFLNNGETLIWGQGATSKTKDGARSVINGDADKSLALITAFSDENQNTEFDWRKSYGAGSDVLHFKVEGEVPEEAM